MIEAQLREILSAMGAFGWRPPKVELKKREYRCSAEESERRIAAAQAKRERKARKLADSSREYLE